MNQICVLHSGGIDSTAVLLWYLHKQKKEVIPLHIDYGQINESTEWERCLAIAKQLELTRPVKIEAGLKNLCSDHRIISGKKKTSSNDFLDHLAAEFFPNRNLYLLTLASVFCYKNHINTIALGIIDGGTYSYTDTDLSFLRKVNSLFNHTLNITVEAPLIKWDKQKVIRFLNKNNFDVNLTYSCNTKSQTPCGKCAACQERNIALKNVN